MKCKYCNHWQEINPDLINIVKISASKFISERYCRVAGKRNLGNDDACKKIKVSKYFYCNEYGERPAVIICLYRQGLLKRKPYSSKDNNSCPCSQGMLEIAELQRGRNLLLEHEYIKHKLPPIRKQT